MRQEILMGVERRRRWSDEQKLSILSEVGVDGASVSDVARRHNLTRQHLYRWRSWLRQRYPSLDQGVRFLPVEAVEGRPVSPASCEPPGSGRVEILLRNGRSIGVLGDPSDERQTRIIRIAETA